MGFNTLYEFVVNRPALRAEALNVLLELTTYPGKPNILDFILPSLTIAHRKANSIGGHQSCQAMGTQHSTNELHNPGFCSSTFTAPSKAAIKRRWSEWRWCQE